MSPRSVRALALTNLRGAVDEVMVSTSAVADGVDREVRGRTPVQRAAAAMFLLGSAAAGLGIWTTEQLTSSRAVQAAISGAFLLVGLRMALPRPVRSSTVELAAVGAIPAVGVLVVLGEPLSAAPFFLLWPVVLIAYFFGRAQLVRGGVLAVVTLGVSLVLHSPSPIKVDMFMATVISIGLLAWLVFTMTERQRTLRVRLAEAADTDPLTGVLNRRAFHPRLEAAVARATAVGHAAHGGDVRPRPLQGHQRHPRSPGRRRRARALR